MQAKLKLFESCPGQGQTRGLGGILIRAEDRTGGIEFREGLGQGEGVITDRVWRPVLARLVQRRAESIECQD